jgi:cyanophycinase
MILVLFGSGEFTPMVDDIDEYIIKTYSPKSIAIIPTAAGLESDVLKWIVMAENHYQKFNLKVIPVPIFNKAQANDDSLVNLLLSVDLIFFSGGNPNYLLNTLIDTKLWRMVEKRIAEGVLLAGSSAGAMIMGKYVLAHPFKVIFDNNTSDWQPGFKLVDYTVVPHFEHFKKHKKIIKLLLENSPTDITSSWLGIDENTAIFFKDTTVVSIKGTGGVEIHNGSEIQHLTAN